MVMTKSAQCSCGALRAEVAGDPTGVVVCHCIDCQRRSGSPFGAGAYYPSAQVRISGESQLYTRDTASGGKFHQHFCPGCGTTLYWFADNRPEAIGIAVGAFADPAFPIPVRSVWEQSRHTWVELPDGLQHFPRGRSG